MGRNPISSIGKDINEYSEDKINENVLKEEEKKRRREEEKKRRREEEKRKVKERQKEGVSLKDQG